VAAILDTRTEAAEAAGHAEPPGRQHAPRKGSRIGMIGVLVVLAATAIAWWMLR
jgi:hypothetical protein